MASVVLIPELYSKRKNTGSVMRWIAASLPRLGFMFVASVKETFQFIVCKRMRCISPRHRSWHLRQANFRHSTLVHVFDEVQDRIDT